jgi:Zn-dependent oligopeptidase
MVDSFNAAIIHLKTEDQVKGIPDDILKKVQSHAKEKKLDGWVIQIDRMTGLRILANAVNLIIAI